MIANGFKDQDKERGFESKNQNCRTRVEE